MTNKHVFFVLASLCGVATLAASGAKAQTAIQPIDVSNAATAQYNGSPAAENVDSLTDATPTTKFLTFHPQTWVQYAMNRPTIVKKYALTVADDFPGRDPKNWTLQGSKDGLQWDTLDTRTNQNFRERLQREEYNFPNNIAYSYYRLNVTANHGDVNTQFADWEVMGTPTNVASAVEFPPATWKEHWFEHNQLMKRVYHDTDVAVYFDSDVAGSVTWPFQYIGDVWRYTKKTYGDFGKNPQLYAVLHSGKYSGGHPSGYHDASHDYRNVIDVGPGPWATFDFGAVAVPTHEVGHIVESDAKGTHGSPAFGLWGDSKWMEIYIYDVYRGLGRDDFADKWRDEMLGGVDKFPRENTRWFRDWFYPIYDQYGQTEVLNRYFTLLAENFRKKRNGVDYDGAMNWGEFVHFWSGAAGVNLKPQATKAFGWPDEWETQWKQAQLDYPDVVYTEAK